ncbi:MAG: GGDEF domain-containing protein [Treponema sp.]|nr:GGDEF domain-containing protein [Candidatus Treponema merdequi]
MKKTVALFVQEIWSDYTRGVEKGILEYFKDKEVNVLIAHLRLPVYEDEGFGMQYWSSLDVMKTQNVDAVIVCTPTICSRISAEQLSEYLEPVSDKPIISLSFPLNVKRNYYTTMSCENAYLEFVTHMVKEHRAKRFAFMSADINSSAEAKERMDAFNSALAKNGLSLSEDDIYYGDFVFASAVNALSKKLKNKDDVKFDTIFAANDMMALGCVSYLNELGLRVPEDIRVVGFDDISQTETGEIKLSTINQQIEYQGNVAAEIAYKIINGQSVNQETKIDVKTVYRHSCGCEYKQKINLIEKNEVNLLLEAKLREENNLHRIENMLDNTQSEETLEIVFNKIYDLMNYNDINFLACCLFDEPVFVDVGSIPKVPQQARMWFYVDRVEEVIEVNKNYVVDLNKEYLCSDVSTDRSKKMLMVSIFYGDYNYGYIMIETNFDNLNLNNIYLKIISNEIATAYKYTKNLEEKNILAEKNIDLNIKSFTDELTGLMNRRGLMKFGVESINLSLSLGKKGMVLFCDMDHLKLINDNYGHEYGDKAIKAQAEILQRTFRTNDLISRLGGDEFVIVASGLTVSKLDDVKLRLEKYSSEVKSEFGLPFDVSISIGGVPYSDQSCDLEKLIKAADVEQYKEKEIHHARIK